MKQYCFKVMWIQNKVGSCFTKSEMYSYILCYYTSSSGILSSFFFYFNSTYVVFIFNILSEDAESAHSSVIWGKKYDKLCIESIWFSKFR